MLWYWTQLLERPHATENGNSKKKRCQRTGTDDTRTITGAEIITETVTWAII